MVTNRRTLIAALVALTSLVAVMVPAAPAGASEVDVAAFGYARDLGAPEGHLNSPIIDIESHPRDHGYWVLGSDGGVFSHGAAAFWGSTGNLVLNQPVIALETHPTGRGYWLLASDGGVFSFGDAGFWGSTGNLVLNEPVVDMAASPNGSGYWLVARDGGIFSFGNARFHGSTGGMPLGSSVVGIAPTPSGEGYITATADGRVFVFGDAQSFGEAYGTPITAPIVDIEITGTGAGYWLLGGDGSVHAFGDAIGFGGADDAPLGAVGMATTPEGYGYWIATVPSTSAPPPGSGEGRRIVYSNSAQRVWLVESNGFTSHSWLVSGRQGVPVPGSYSVFSKSIMSTAHNGELLLPKMTRFAWGRTAAIGFHAIPLRTHNRSPIQTEGELGQYRSAGCVRMAQSAIDVLWDWAPVGTPVIVTA